MCRFRTSAIFHEYFWHETTSYLGYLSQNNFLLMYNKISKISRMLSIPESTCRSVIKTCNERKSLKKLVVLDGQEKCPITICDSSLNIICLQFSFTVHLLFCKHHVNRFFLLISFNISVLDSQLWPVIARHFPDDSYVFQDDNALVHRARIVERYQYKHDNNIHGMVWPAQSSDINVIENCWLRIKRTLQYQD
jgi:hypothetical protein